MTLPTTDLHPLSSQQQRMIDFIAGPTDSYYLQLDAFVLQGDVSPQALRTALVHVLDRHDILRAAYPVGQPGYRVLDTGDALIDLIHTEISAGTYSTTEEALEAGAESLRRPLVLASEPPLRTWLATLADGTWVLMIAGHHLALDAWSFMLFYEDLAAEYRAALDNSAPRARPQQYVRAQAAAGSAVLEGWSELLGRDYRSTRELAASADGPMGPGLVLRQSWDGLGARVAAVAKNLSATPFVIGAAAMMQALREVLEDDQVILGTAFAGRTTAAATEAMGYYSTTLFLGEDLSAHNSERDLVVALNRSLRSWHGAPRVQWEDLLAQHQAEDLYPIKFSFQPKELTERQLALPGVSARKVTLRRTVLNARRPVDLVVAYDRNAVSAAMTVRTDAVPEPTAQRLLDFFGGYLVAFADKYAS